MPIATPTPETPTPIRTLPPTREIKAEIDFPLTVRREIGAPVLDDDALDFDCPILLRDSPPRVAAVLPRPPKPIMELSLYDEVSPLIEQINVLCGTGRMLRTEGPLGMRREIPRHVIPRIGRQAVRIEFASHDFDKPSGFRLQLLFTLLQTAMNGRERRRHRSPGIGERRRGSLRAPLEFELELRTAGMEQRSLVRRWLHIACAETDTVPAIRRQVDLLCEHLADPANILPLDPAFFLNSF